MFRDKIKKLGFFFIILLILLFVVCGPRLAGLSIQELLNYTPKSLALATVIFLGLYCLKAIVMFIPLTILYISAGIIFPWWWAISLTYLCLVLESTIGFLLGRRMGRQRVQAIIRKKKYGKKFMEFSTNNGILSCFVLRLIPGPPIELTNMFAGTTDIKYHHFIIGTLLGYSPGMIPLVLMGKAAGEPLSAEFLIPFVLSLVITLIAVGGYVWRKKRRIRLLE